MALANFPGVTSPAVAHGKLSTSAMEHEPGRGGHSVPGGQAGPPPLTFPFCTWGQ